VIASMLHRIDYIEKIGTGISRIKRAVKEHGGINVDIRFDEFFTVIFELKKLSNADDGSQKSSQKSSQKILNLMQQNPAITIHELAEEIGISDRAIKRQITRLKEQGQLIRIGADRGGHWQVID